MHSGSSLGMKRPGRKANHALPSSVMLKMCATTIMPPYVPTRRGASLNTVGHFAMTLYVVYCALLGK
jgi:hypothetical protein